MFTALSRLIYNLSKISSAEKKIKKNVKSFSSQHAVGTAQDTGR